MTGISPKNTRIKTEELTNRIRCRNNTLPGNPEARSMGQCCRNAKPFLAFFGLFCGQPEKKPNFAKPKNGLMNAFDAGAKLGELFLDPLVATIQMVNAINQGLALRHETGDH